MVETFAEQNVLVVGTARDCEERISGDVLKLFEALRECRSVSWLIVESDSSDRTASELELLANRLSNFRFICMGNLSLTVPKRTSRLAICRNAYLAELSSNSLYDDVTCVVVADLDGANALVTAGAFRSCWERSDWDVCTANQRGPYFDVYALRHPDWCPNDCLRQLQFLQNHRVREGEAMWAALYSKMINIPEPENWIEVDSAFGGLAVYRRRCLDGVTYSGLTEDGEEICEHVPMHRRLKDKGCRIFINPRLINAGVTEHSMQATIPRIRLLYRELRAHAKAAITTLRRFG